MSCYAVIDTNVLISALLSSKENAATVQIVSKLINGEIIPLYSHAIIDEYQNVLSRNKFGFSQEIISYLLSAVKKYGVNIVPSPTSVILPDMKDLPFFEAAFSHSQDGAFLVTGNIKHFPKETFIVTPREMIDMLNNEK